MIAHGADITLKDSEGRTARDLAKKYIKNEVTKLTNEVAKLLKERKQQR